MAPCPAFVGGEKRNSGVWRVTLLLSRIACETARIRKICNMLIRPHRRRRKPPKQIEPEVCVTELLAPFDEFLARQKEEASSRFAPSVMGAFALWTLIAVVWFGRAQCNTLAFWIYASCSFLANFCMAVALTVITPSYDTMLAKLFQKRNLPDWAGWLLELGPVAPVFAGVMYLNALAYLHFMR